MEFNFANQQDKFISQELIFAKSDFPKQKICYNKLKSLFLYPKKQKNDQEHLKTVSRGNYFSRICQKIFFAAI